LQVRVIGGAVPPLRLFFISVASKGLNVHVSGLESTLAGISTSVDSKGFYVALELCKVAYSLVHIRFEFLCAKPRVRIG